MAGKHGKWFGGVINPSSKNFSNVTAESNTGGVWSIEDQYVLRNADRWPGAVTYYPDSTGERIDVSGNIITTTTNADNAADYSVAYVNMTSATQTLATGRLYIRVKVTASTTYYNDFCIGGIQLHSDDYSNLEQAWSFSHAADKNAWEIPSTPNVSSAYANNGLETLTSVFDVAGQSWNGSWSNSSPGWYTATSTGSSRTGAADGIGTAYSKDAQSPSAPTSIEPGITAVAQAGSTNFLFTETSGSGANTYYWIRSPEFTWGNVDDTTMEFIYHACTSTGSGGMQDVNDDDALIKWIWTNKA